jgi:hypothetical protein
LFVVYSDDQVTARYILSPVLMQRIVTFRTRMNLTIALSFIDSHMYIAIPGNKNRLEPPLVSSAQLSIEEIRAYLADIAFAEGVIQDLNLNTRIWTKT